jgi:hypothetical protein
VSELTRVGPGGGERPEPDAGASQGEPDPADQVDRARGVAVHTDRAGSQAEQAAVDGFQPASGGQPQAPLHHHRGVGQHRARHAARHQPAVRGVGPVGEGLLDHGHPGGPGPLQPGGPRQPQDDQSRVEQPHGLDQGVGLRHVGDRRRVEGAVRLDVGHPGPGDPGETGQRPQLVEHVVGELGGLDVDEPPAEAGQVPVGDLGSDGHPSLGGPPADPAQRRGVTGVETAGHVGAGDDVQQALVVAQPPDAETLTEVAVEIDAVGGVRAWVALVVCHGSEQLSEVGQGAGAESDDGHDVHPDEATITEVIAADGLHEPIIAHRRCSPRAPRYLSSPADRPMSD